MNSKNRKFLGKKTERNNFTDHKQIDRPKTTIKLISLLNNRHNSNDYAYIKFSDSTKISLDKLIANNTQTIKLKISSNKIYKIYTIELFNKKGNKRQCFNLPIYINKINTLYINLRPKKKGYCFEYIFYRKNVLKVPKNLLYKKEILLDKFDDYNLKYRKKIIVINVEKNLTDKYIKKNLPLDNNSYKICIRINDDGKEFSSVHRIQLEKIISSETFKLKANTSDIKKIYKLFEEFKTNKSLKSIKENKQYKCLINDNAFMKFIKKYPYINKSYLEIDKISDNDVNILKEYLLKFILKYFFIDINNITAPARLNYINKKLLKMINNIEAIINDIEQFTQNIDNSRELQFRLFRATLYNLYSITVGKSSDKEACLEILSEYKQKIIDIKTISKKNPYFKAIKFLKDIANNLNENSSLFDLLMQYNCGFSDNINLIWKKRKTDNGVKFSQFELSMLTVDEVANHLKDILPTFLIRYTCNDNVNAFYSGLNDLIFINEKKTFNKSSIVDFDDKKKYTLPIVIILLHESWGHKKVVLSNLDNKGIKDTPIRHYLRSKNFVEDIIMTIKKDSGKIKGESGLGIEFLISDSKNTANCLSQYLLDYTTDNSNLLDAKLWVQPNFDNLQLLIVKNILKSIKNNPNFNLGKYKDGEENYDTSIYFPKTYYVDGVTIGPFFKV